MSVDTSTVVESTAAVGSSRNTWDIDPVHSSVEFSVRHLMVSSAKGRFTGVVGTIVIDEADPTRSSADVTIEAASVDTREEKRDAHLRSADFLDTEQHPQITFKSTRVDPEDEENYKVYGDLTIHGVTKEVVLKTEYNGRSTSPWGSEVIGFSASTKVSRKAFGLNYNPALEAGGVVVGDEVKIQLDLEAIKKV
jgi:polyisoprenoid-binding protein YceI